MGVAAWSGHARNEETCHVVTVLVCDDDATIRQLIELNRGWTAMRCSRPVTVVTLDRAMALRPSLLLLDARMPGLSGYTVCARLRAVPTGATIMLTADTLGSALALARGGRG